VSSPALRTWHDRGAVLSTIRSMPLGVRVFLVYGLGLLAFLGLTLPLVVSQAVTMPVSAIGVLWMLLLAYAIFTLTLVLQRKQAAYGLSLGLASLTIPLVLVLGVGAGLPGALFAGALAVILFLGLLRPSTRGWFAEP
jgi:hypothetical protein